MTTSTLRVGSLVLYKQKAARILKIDPKKIEIDVQNSKKASVRDKDVTLLHVGPLDSLTVLQQQPAGDIESAWELLEGEETNLAELAELIYDEFTPLTAWSTWQLIADGVYFSGTIDSIEVHDRDTVEHIETGRAAKAVEEAAWSAFMERAQQNQYLPEDERYLDDVVAVATGQREKSKVLQTLGRVQTPENAHDFLLKLGFWDETVNPHPRRLGVALNPPTIALPPLPEEERCDLTHLTALAIDDAGSREPDDAISWDNGRLWVHIADPAALVAPDSEADLEARARGANLYLPEGTIPMLPPPATEILGLGLNELSPALSFGIDLDETGEIIQTEIMPSWVRVTRLSYDEAEARLDEDILRPLYAVAQRYEARRLAAGSVVIDLPEVKMRLDDQGEVHITPLPALRSRNLVRECMLMTGEAVARFALDHEILIPFSTQEPPDLSDVMDDEEPRNPDSLSAMFALRRTMKPGVLRSIPGPHAGLGMALYTQATSPLRRYLDLVTHQQLRAYLQGRPMLDAQAITERIGAASSVIGSLRRAERQSNLYWKLVYLLRNPKWSGTGIVVDKRGRRDAVLIPELALETQVYSQQETPLDGTIELQLKGVDLAEMEARF